MDYVMEHDLVEAIEEERRKQIAQWGGAEHDDTHDGRDWRRFREKFEDRILKRLFGHLDEPMPLGVQRDALIKIIALAVAQYESVERQELEMGG